jgi:WD40 repeat protein
VFRLRADEDSTAWKLRIDQCNTHNDGVWKVATSAWEGQVGCLLASASADRSAVIYSPQHRRELGVATHRGAVLSVRFHPSERLLLTASGDRSCAIWCVPDAFGDGEERGDSPVGFDTNEDNGRSDGRLPAGGSFRLSLSPQGAPDRRLLRNNATLWGHLQAVTCADWLHSGGQVVTASADKTAMIFDAARGASKPLRSMVGHDGPLTWVSASRTRGIILTASKDCTARLWDTRSSRADAAQHVFQGHSNTVGVAVLAPDCAFALTGSDDATIKIWDLRAARTPLLTLKSGRHGVRDLALDQRAGLMAAALGHGTTRVYTLDGAKAGVLSREGAVQTPRFTSACAFGGDDAEFGLFTAGFDPGLVQLWQAPSCSTHPPNPTATLQASARGGDSGSFIATEPSEISPTSGLDRLDAA